MKPDTKAGCEQAYMVDMASKHSRQVILSPFKTDIIVQEMLQFDVLRHTIPPPFYGLY
jgi:hypothetical protein